MLFTFLLSLLPIISALPSDTRAKRSSPLSCVQFQYQSPFTAFGEEGFIHLYSNVTYYNSTDQTTSFTEKRLGLVNGTIEPCGECRTTELFGFEVCQDSITRNGFNGLENTASEFYGHITYRNLEVFKCLQAESTNFNGSKVILADCKYDYEGVGSSGQYFQLDSATGESVTRLVDDQSNSYGPNPGVDTGSPLVLFDGPFGGDLPFTYFGFKAPVF